MGDSVRKFSVGTRVGPALLAPWGQPPRFRPPHAEEAAELAHVYRRVDEALEEVASSCRVCGRCCRFGPDTPVLFASSLELAGLVAQVGRPPPQRRVLAGRADAPWKCPYQSLATRRGEGARCTARNVRPLGCRTFFCNVDARRRGEQVYGDAIQEVRRIVAKRQTQWWYGPARFYFAGLRAERA